MKEMSVNEMKKVNGGVAFSTLCGYALFSWGVSCYAGLVKKMLRR